MRNDLDETTYAITGNYVISVKKLKNFRLNGYSRLAIYEIDEKLYEAIKMKGGWKLNGNYEDVTG